MIKRWRTICSHLLLVIQHHTRTNEAEHWSAATKPKLLDTSIWSKITFIMSSVCASSWVPCGAGEADCMGDPTTCDTSPLPFDCPSFPVNPLRPPRSTLKRRASKSERRGEPDEDILPCAWAWSRSCCCWGVNIWNCCGPCKKDFWVDTPNPGRSWSMPYNIPTIQDISIYANSLRCKTLPYCQCFDKGAVHLQ